MKIKKSYHNTLPILMVFSLLPSLVFSLDSITSFTENTLLLTQQKRTSKAHEVTSVNPEKDKLGKHYNDENTQNVSKADLIQSIVKKEHTIIQLLKKQREITTTLNKTSTYTITILLLCICFVFSFLYQYRKAKCYQTHLKKLIEERNNTNNIENQHIQKATPSNNIINVPEKHIAYIITKLEEFENQKQYLTPGLSAHSLADHIKTNVKYLSQVIKYSKNKTFSSYINELRITYAITSIKENAKFRKYTIKAIANEIGYGSAETFSNAFYKQVGIKPSCFIRSFNK